MKRLITAFGIVALLATWGGIQPAGAVRQVTATTAGGGVISIHCAADHVAQVDPIVAPGGVSLHVHTFFGNSSTNANSTYATMTAGTAAGVLSSCALSKDSSAYWYPQLLDANGVPAPINFITTYYRSPKGTTVTPFPADLRIIAGGDTDNRPVAPGVPQNVISWGCKDTGPFFTHTVDCTGKALIANVHFPNCLLQGATDSTDHRSHMAYSTGKGVCPAGFYQVPTLTLHVQYPIKNGSAFHLTSDLQGAGCPVLACENGEALHADFWNTWNQPALEFLINTCVNGGLTCTNMTDVQYAALGGPA